MPAITTRDVVLPDEVKEKLQDLEKDFEEGDVTTKGYCKKKWKLLEGHVSHSIAENVRSLQVKLETSKISEVDYCNNIMTILELTHLQSKPDNGNLPDKNELNSPEKMIENDSSFTKNASRRLSNAKKPSGPQINLTSPPTRSTRQSSGKSAKTNQPSSSNGKKNGTSQASIEAFFSAALKEEHIKSEQLKDGDDSEEEIESLKGVQDKQTSKNGETKVNKEAEIKKEAVVSDREMNSDESEDETDKRKKKRVKLDTNKSDDSTMVCKPPKSSKVAPTKCTICHQLLNDADLQLYQGHPDQAVEEFIALTDPKLSLFTGDEAMVNENDERPQNKLTCFSVYDKQGHLCPFDTGLIEKNVLLYVSGYIKPVYEESSDIEGGIPTKDLGPINEWWVSGFDGGELALIGFSTAYGEYYLMEPSKDYAPFMTAIREKIFLSKVVIEFLLDEVDPPYEDLLNQLSMIVPPNGLGVFTEDCLLKHAQFVCDQVMSFDAAAAGDEALLIVTSCMRALIKLSGVSFGKRRTMRHAERKNFKERKAPAKWSKATTTELVKNVFEMFFTEQLDKEAEGQKGPRRKRCGVCEACQLADCGTCIRCKGMVKFGGPGTSKQACDKRRCPNMAIQEADDSEPEEEGEEEGDVVTNTWVESHRNKRIRNMNRLVEWVGDSVAADDRRTFYTSIKISDEIVNVNDCVMVETTNPVVPFVIARVMYMWEDKKKGNKWFHAQLFCRGTDTVMGETADPTELFLVDVCEDCLIWNINRKAEVTFRETPDNWAMLGGEPLMEVDKTSNTDSKTFFYQKIYHLDFARFEDPPVDPPCKNPNALHRFCAACERTYIKKKINTPSVDEKLTERDSLGDLYAVARWKNQEYRVGNSVFLHPETFRFKSETTMPASKEKVNPDKFDEDIYPEFYRKHTEHVGGNESTSDPFCIGYVSAIINRGTDKLMTMSDIYIRVNKFYRPENTHRGAILSQQMDLNKLYWSNEEKVVNFADILGKCNVVFSENLEDILVSDWTSAGPNRFYFSQAYNRTTQNFEDPPKVATMIGKQGKGKGKGKGKSSVKKTEEKAEEKMESWPPVSAMLRSLDVFAGCGGLSEGLHQSGAAESRWAVEKEEVAAMAFKLNNPQATVFTDDCNELLKLVMNGEKTNDIGQNLPLRGEVELLCGGPPCQGFSGMNRFNSRQYSLFKNSLIVSYLSYCDYYRPRFFILENVRNFVSFKSSIVLKLTLRCLIRMGYQCTFGVLQAGNYGVPQTRRRAIILAAAPGEKLPLFPEPTHVFSRKGCQLAVVVDGKKYVTNCEWDVSAPYRTITVRDSMSDLPSIRNGHMKEEMSYGGEPQSHFQRLIRTNQYQPLLRDHICKMMAPTTEARIANIPTAPGSDWRDLPNIAVRLNDGSYAKQLVYTHPDKKNGKSSTGAMRGVCTCATGKSCDPMDRQFNTLIPWCLPHTGNRHNNWAGLYGRLEWDGYFKTTVTNPEPMGKQGRVLHPEQTRVVSVRECARSQGFPDTYRFYGTIIEKHRQVGNAVPPPMGAAIGLEIRKCVSHAELKNKEAVKEMDVD